MTVDSKNSVACHGEVLRQVGGELGSALVSSRRPRVDDDKDTSPTMEG